MGENLLETLKNIDQQITLQSSGLQNITENMDTQSRLNTAAIEQQHKLLLSALGKIETGKNNIKQQMEDILRLVNTINDETVNSVKSMEANLTENLQKSEAIINNTTDASEKLQIQLQSFENTSNQAVAKVLEFNNHIKENKDNIENFIENAVGQAENITNTISSQIQAINEASVNTTNKHNKLLDLFNQQSSILNSTAENTLDEKAEAINILFKNQQDEFYAICDKLSDNTGNIGNTLKNQITLLEQGSDRVFSRMSNFEDEFTKKASLLTNTSNLTMDKLSAITNMLTKQNQEIDHSVEGITSKMHKVGEEVSHFLSIFNENLQAVKNESSTAGNEITENCNKLKDLQRAMIVDTQNVKQDLEKQVKALNDNLSLIEGKTDSIAANFNKQNDMITEIVNLVSTQTRLGEASLAQQYKYLSETATDVNAKIHEIEQAFQSNTSSIFDNSNKIAFEINSLSDKLIKAAEDVQKATKNSVSELQAVDIALTNSADTLKETVGTSHKNIDSVLNKYQNQIAAFNTVTAEASSGVIEVNNLIAHQNDKMIKISEDTKNLVSSFNTVLNEASNQLVKRANSAYEQIKEMSTQMKELSLQLEDSTQLTAKHMSDAGDKMRANINEIAANSERISNDIRSSGEVFLKQSDVLVNSTTDTISKVSQAMELLRTGSENLSVKGKQWLEQSDEFAKVFERQAEIIDTTSLKATENLRKLETKYQEVQTDSFLKDAATLFERMETIAIDINRIFNPTTEEEIWKKYYSGDTAAFVRYLAKVMTKNQINQSLCS